MDENPYSEVEIEENEPPELLDNLLDELVAYAKDHDEEMTAEWLPEESIFTVASDNLPEVDVYLVDIDDALYGEAEALVVESEIGLMDSDIDPAELLRFCDKNFIYSRLSLSKSGDEEFVILQAACPVSQVSAAQLDSMVREVAVFSQQLSEEDEED